MARKKIKLGAIIKIRIDEDYHTYGRIVGEDFDVAVYDCRTKEDIEDLNEIVSKSILFVIGVDDSVIREGRWVEIGHIPIWPGEIQMPQRYRQDRFNPEKCTIIDHDGNKRRARRATIEECVGLDLDGAWLPESIEERLRDFYIGRRNRIVESRKVIKPGQYAGIQQLSRGDLIMIPFDKNYHTYARIWGPYERDISSDELSSVVAAAYDCRTKEDIHNMSEIVSKPLLFVVVIYGETVQEANWTKVGKIPMSDYEHLDFKIGAVFTQDIFEPERCMILAGASGRWATVEECEGLERSVTWEAGEVEERIRDHYAGRKNRMLEYWRLRYPSENDLLRARSKKKKTKKKKKKKRSSQSLNKYKYEDLKKFFVCMLELDEKEMGFDIIDEIHPAKFVERLEQKSLSMAKKSVIIGIQERLAVFRHMDREDIERYDAYLKQRGALTLSELGKSVQDQIADIFKRGKIETENEYHMVMELLNDVDDETLTDADREEANELISKFENEPQSHNSDDY